MLFLERHGKVVKAPFNLSVEEYTFMYNGRTHQIFISTDGLSCFYCRTLGQYVLITQARRCPKKSELIPETKDDAVHLQHYSELMAMVLYWYNRRKVSI